MTKQENKFETSMERLQNVVQALESGNLTLDESLILFEEGMQLVKDCKTELIAAEERVSTLLKTEDGFEEKPGT